MARDAARRLSVALRVGCALAAIAVVAIIAWTVPACYQGGGGTNPPTNTFYFPVGLGVSAGGHVLYAANSDFDLQWNGGTLQSYDLAAVRRDTLALIQANFGTSGGDASGLGNNVWLADGGGDAGPPPQTQVQWFPDCLGDAAILSNGSRIPLGEACAPPVDSTRYKQDSAIIGAFATQLELEPVFTFGYGTRVSIAGAGPTRMYIPVRGDATLTWADLTYDDPNTLPPNITDGGPAPSAFRIQCGQSPSDLICDGEHHTNITAPDNTRQETLPGQPFGLALTDDGTAITITAQTEPMTSLLLSGFSSPFGTGQIQGAVAGTDANVSEAASAASVDAASADAAVDLLDAGTGVSAGLPTINQPTMEFVLNGVPNAGDSLVPVPHDLDAPQPPCESLPPNSGISCVRPAFLETFHDAAEVDLLRYFSDDGSSLERPYLLREKAFDLTVNQQGTDSRGIVIDPSPRLACKLQAGGPSAPFAARQACAQIPARVFFANRTPPSLVVGEIGEPSASGDGSYDPDQLKLLTSVPALTGVSRVYLAPIISASGQLVLRVFLVNFDSSTIQIFDPNDPDLALVDTLYVGAGPFAMAFDPFTLDDVVASSLDPNAVVPELARDSSQPNVDLNRYRFAYIASFTNSYVQIIDLDARQPTFEQVVYNLGYPTPPKGTQ